MSPVEKKINYTFKDKNLLNQALTHKSYSNENIKAPHNERFEFLGDAILQFISTKKLFSIYKDLPEGILSTYRSNLVKTEFLANVALSIGIKENLKLSVGQEKEFRKDGNVSILADATESIIGALYLDGGLSVAEKFIEENILKNMDVYISENSMLDSKTKFQELVQRDFNITPIYKIIKQEGPDHSKLFYVEVLVKDKPYGTGKGASKQEAEKKAAEKAIKKYNSKK